jgi:hypothetical protein
VSDTPLIAGHAAGYRVWRVTNYAGDLALRSTHYPFVWPAGEPFTAWCSRGSTPACLTHACGIHAFTELDHARAYMGAYRAAFGRHLFVLGTVAGAGHVIEHEDGWRAERAAVLSLEEWGTGRDITLTETSEHALAEEIVGRLAVLYGVDRERERSHAWASPRSC